MSSAFPARDEEYEDHADVAHCEDALPLAEPAAEGELPPSDLDAWLDRLVDGEVAEPQRRALLARMEQSPSGWRRCALAFLEAQAWREALDPAELLGDSLRAPASPAAPESVQPGLRVVSPQGVSQGVVDRLASNWRPVVGMLAAVASFLLAFTLGLGAQKWWLAPGGGHSSGSIAGAKTGPPQTPDNASPTQRVPADQRNRNWGDSNWGNTNWGTVQFVVDGPGGNPQQVRAPAIDSPDIDAQHLAEWLRDQPPAIPDEVVRELRRLGHHVETQRRYLPVPLDDGRGAVFPVDQVEVRLRGGQGYQ